MNLHLWKENDVWYFNDEEKEIKKEPFVMGSSELITLLAESQGIFSHTLNISFDSVPFDGYQFKLKKLEKDGNWTLYGEETTEKIGWLCPVLYFYFSSPPKTLYIKLSE
jgi:hypothetical protein